MLEKNFENLINYSVYYKIKIIISKNIKIRVKYEIDAWEVFEGGICI